MTDRNVIIRHPHLLSSLIDKSHRGLTLQSVVHCYYELYGKSCAADLGFNCFYQTNLAADQQSPSVIFDLDTHSGYDSDNKHLNGDIE
ncbi:unnamed protein product [Rotaria sp. Silwood1]|nr:unnamed protein product [Rotaria sp. Silwood1]CAF3720749.1 unnamed protein product [Rotaria sp. Silwood1]CAF3732735.1 unnamed protein product [Rotaria sp. Silwood1]CAF4752404.1 unnamed protein product [Rotaria sp. Silwood1]CAF5009880.1 unnamed protein product [Rotaria sp. Silwood1]